MIHSRNAYVSTSVTRLLFIILLVCTHFSLSLFALCTYLLASEQAMLR